MSLLCSTFYIYAECPYYVVLYMYTQTRGMGLHGPGPPRPSTAPRVQGPQAPHRPAASRGGGAARDAAAPPSQSRPGPAAVSGGMSRRGSTPARASLGRAWPLSRGAKRRCTCAPRSARSIPNRGQKKTRFTHGFFDFHFSSKIPGEI